MSSLYTIKDACNITTGRLDANRAEEHGKYPFFTCGATPERINSFAFDDDVILIAGNNAHGNFHVSRYTGKFNAYQRTYVLTVKENFNLDYIYYALKLELKRLKEKAQGSQTKFLTKPIVEGISFPKLKNEEQQKISSVLLSLDKKIACNNRINAELEAMAKTLYDYWFVQFDFPNKDGKPYKSSGGAMHYNEELKRDIPEGWTNGTLANLGDIVGGSTPSTKNENNFTAQGTAWITPNDLSENKGNKFIGHGAKDVTDAGVKDASLKKYPTGTVLLSSRAPVGYMAIARNELTTNQGFKSFIPNKGYPSEFIFYAVKHMLPIIEQNASGSTFKEISASTLKNIKVPLPNSTLIEGFTTRICATFKKQNAIEKENQELAKLRDWLLPMLMNGQVSAK